MDRSFLALTGIAAALTFTGTWFAAAPTAPLAVAAPSPAADLSEIDVAPPPRTEHPEVPRDSEPRPAVEADPPPVRSATRVYYSGCNEARAAGAAPIHRGEPGYREDMDGDHDGIACEPRPGV